MYFLILKITQVCCQDHIKDADFSSKIIISDITNYPPLNIEIETGDEERKDTGRLQNHSWARTLNTMT